MDARFTVPQDGPLRERPSKDDVSRLPLFEGLPLSRIGLLRTPADCDVALASIEDAGVVGFDTESKPTFAKGAVRDGPHVIQFALRDRAFIVQVGAAPPIDFLRAVIESPRIVKVGFGLVSDRGPLQQKLGLTLAAAVDLTQVLRALRYRNALGVKAAVAVVLGRRIQKSRSMTTSNWAVPTLQPNQLLYAANDAYAALAVFDALGSPEPASIGDTGEDA